MTNPVIDNIRHSLGRTESTLVGQHPAIFESRQAGSRDSEFQFFFYEIKKLSGVGQRLALCGIAETLKTTSTKRRFETFHA